MWTARTAQASYARPARNLRIDELVDLATAGQLPTTTTEVVAPVVAARAEYKDAAEAAAMWKIAMTTAETRLKGLLVQDADAFVTCTPRPAHTEVMAEGRKAAKVLGSIAIDDLEVVHKAPAAIQAAFLGRQGVLAGQYAHIRDARAALGRLAGIAPSEFMETSRERPRWPSSPVARPLALAASGSAWMPTFSEERKARREANDAARAEVKAMYKRTVPAAGGIV